LAAKSLPTLPPIPAPAPITKQTGFIFFSSDLHALGFFVTVV
jgi:hypothetical protein